MKLFTRIFLYIILIVGFGCERYDNQIIRLKIINKIQDCEEQNIHFNIMKDYSSNHTNHVGKIILPVLNDSLDTAINNQLLFPAFTDKRLEFIVEGHISKKPIKGSTYGCIGAYKFRISRIVKWVDVTDSKDYPISN